MPIVWEAMRTDISRRQMLLMSALAAAAFSPVGRALAAGSGASLDAGEMATFDKDGIYSGLADQGVFLIRQGKRLVAQSARCTHKGCRLTPSDVGFSCHCHGSTFALDGRVTRPPARRDLPRFGVHMDGRKHIMVDTGKVYQSAQFGLAGAFLDVA